MEAKPCRATGTVRQMSPVNNDRRTGLDNRDGGSNPSGFLALLRLAWENLRRRHWERGAQVITRGTCIVDEMKAQWGIR